MHNAMTADQPDHLDVRAARSVRAARCRLRPAARTFLALAGLLGALVTLAGAGGCADRTGDLEARSEAVLASYPIAAPSPPGDSAPDTHPALRTVPRPDGRGSNSTARGVGMRHAGAAGAPGATPSAPNGFLAPLARDADRVPITLEACLRRALVSNLQVQIARFGPAIAETYVVEAEALFDPSWYMNNALERVRQDAGTFLAGANTLVAKQWTFNTGVDSLLPTGGTVGLVQDWTYVDSNSQFFAPNPQYASRLGVEVRQPLLRGAGLEVTKSPIVLARLDHRISLDDFRLQVMDTLLEVERVYWRLVVAETRVRALEEALDAARENLRISKRRFDEGAALRVVVSLAESAVTNRRADLVVARLALARTSDDLKRLLNDPALPLDEPVLIRASEQPMAEPIPVTREMYQASMLAAMQSRPEMDQADAALDQANLRERVARNDRLPQLDLAGGYGVTGLDADLDPSLAEELQTEFFDWHVGMEFRIPLGNRARLAAHERSRLERAVASHQREDTRQQVLLEVSRGVRDLASAEESILATRAARQAAEQTLQDQRANVAAGAALQKDLLDAQRDLADAKVREIQAMAAYMTALAELERAKGTLLEYNNVRVLEGEQP